MANLQALLNIQTAGKNQKIGGASARGENAEAANVDLAALLGGEAGSAAQGNFGELFQNIIAAENSNSEAGQKAQGASEKVLPKGFFPNSKEKNISDVEEVIEPKLNLESLKTVEVLPKKLGVQVNKEVVFTEQDIKNLELGKVEVAGFKKSPSNVNDLLNQIKASRNGDTENINSEILPNNQLNQKINGESDKEEIASPLEILLKSSKDSKEAKNEVPADEKLTLHQKMTGQKPEKADSKKLELVQGKGIEQKLQTESGSDFLAIKENLKKPSSAKEFKIEDAIAKEINTKGQAVKAQAYGKEQGLLANNMIQKPQDLLTKEERTKNSPLQDELKVSEFKKHNELQSIKNDTLYNLSPNELAQNINETNANVTSAPIFDMTNLKSAKTEDVIKAVSDYVQQSQIAGKDNLDLTVKHNELGQFKINVSKAHGHNQLEIQITTQTKEAHQFFTRHENDLMRNLSQSGINLSDLRVVSSHSEITPTHESQSKQFYQGSQGQNSSSKQWASSEFTQSGNGSERRKELWEEYRSRLSA